MKIQFFSDLHVDVAPNKPIIVREDIDLVVVAGDTAEGIQRSFVALRKIVPHRAPIVMIAGNHEFYRRSLPDELVSAKAVAGQFNIHFLERDWAVINGTRILGCTLWSDYQLKGANKVRAAMDTARRDLNDHRVIKWRKYPWLRFRPEEAALLHRDSRRFLAETLALPFEGSTVVVTHHAPHPGSLHENDRSRLLSAAYASDLSDLLAAHALSAKIAIWNHGHVHKSADYVVNGVRILANPHGYGQENASFDPCLVAEIGR